MRSQKGQTLIESVVALGIAGVIVTAIVISVVSSLSNTTYTRNQSTASRLAQEGIDILKDIKASSFSSFSAYYGTYCLEEGERVPEAKPSCTLISGTFYRIVRVNPLGLDSTGTQRCQPTPGGYIPTFVSVNVAWHDGKCRTSARCHDIALDSCLTNFNTIPAP